MALNDKGKTFEIHNTEPFCVTNNDYTVDTAARNEKNVEIQKWLVNANIWYTGGRITDFMALII